MTIKELYQWAVENGCEGMRIRVDDYGEWRYNIFPFLDDEGDESFVDIS